MRLDDHYYLFQLFEFGLLINELCLGHLLVGSIPVGVVFGMVKM